LQRWETLNGVFQLLDLQFEVTRVVLVIVDVGKWHFDVATQACGQALMAVAVVFVFRSSDCTSILSNLDKILALRDGKLEV
jgi:hypothetical protein